MLQFASIPNRLRAWFAPDRLRSQVRPHRVALLAITLLSTYFNFWMLGQNGYGNLYYAAAVKSMGSNLHAFFFVSLDPAGFVTVDKPPLGFWMQVVSTKILGFTPFAIFLPQALAGVLSVVILYWLVRRHFGVVAGLLAALALAVSPISVVTNRNNTIDSTLMLALLLGAWTTFRAIESGQLRWLILTAVCVGLGFNIKMLEAYLVVPAFLLAFLLGANMPWVRRITQVLISGGVMVALSLAWVLAVDFIPAALRPYVGSTQNNSELSLALGYNGLQRLLGMGGGTGGAPGGIGGAGGRPQGGPPSGFNPEAFGSGGAFGPPPSASGAAGGPDGGAGTSVGMFNTGNPGLFRLFTTPLGGQIVWLLPLALIGMLALALQSPFRPRENRQQQSLVMWGTWLVTMVIFFSAASFFHQYYLSQMAPAIAALVGIGIVTMWRQYLVPGWHGWLLPLALGITGAEQILIISSDPTWGIWLIPVIAVPTLIAAVGLTIARLRPEISIPQRVKVAVVGLGLFALLAAPTVWSAYPALSNAASDLPVAGSAAQFGAAGGSTQVNTGLIKYLEAHQGSATYLVATPSSNTADPIILATGKAVMALGGFTGSDPILTTTQLQTMVKAGTIHYFLLDSTGTGGGGPGGGQSTLTQWVQHQCTTVAASAYQSTTTTTTQGGFGGAQQLYVCN